MIAVHRSTIGSTADSGVARIVASFPAEKADAAASDVHATWFRKALDAGVRMALGSPRGTA
jgi:hypothetical protein